MNVGAVKRTTVPKYQIIKEYIGLNVIFKSSYLSPSYFESGKQSPFEMGIIQGSFFGLNTAPRQAVIFYRVTTDSAPF
jgi:hypothetical protein